MNDELQRQKCYTQGSQVQLNKEGMPLGYQAIRYQKAENSHTGIMYRPNKLDSWLHSNEMQAVNRPAAPTGPSLPSTPIRRLFPQAACKMHAASSPLEGRQAPQGAWCVVVPSL